MHFKISFKLPADNTGMFWLLLWRAPCNVFSHFSKENASKKFYFQTVVKDFPMITSFEWWSMLTVYCHQLENFHCHQALRVSFYKSLDSTDCSKGMLLLGFMGLESCTAKEQLILDKCIQVIPRHWCFNVWQKCDC